MRTDPAGSQLTAPNREPRIAVGIIYPTGSIYVTNKAALSNVPGNVVHGALEDISSVGRELSPLEARSTIAAFSFSVVDVDGELTDELRAQLVAGEGVGRRDVRVYTGDTDDFTDGTWSLVDTFVVDKVVQYDRGSYRFSCLDRQRQLREKIFPAVSTRLTADLGVGDTTITVANTDGFELVPHTASFSDAPSTSVLYFRIKKTGEIIRATGKTPTTFTGCTRERFNTIAQAVDIDPAAEVDKQPEVELIYYLEMPAPQLAYALMTGDILGTANSLPDGYHVGIDPSFVDDDMFTNIGADLYNPSDVTEGLVLSFATHRGLRETDGKRFIEEQVLFPMWTFLPISNEGKLGLRRLVRLLADAAPVALVDENTIMSHGSLDHQVGEVANRVIINWNHDGDRFTRQSIFTNAGSISAHGIGRTLEFDLLGVTVARHTRETVRRIFDSMTDRHGAPQQTMELELSATLNRLEVGDVIRTALTGVRDYAAAGSLDRSFELQSKSWNPRTGEVRVQGFASTARVEPDQQDGTTPPLSDAWYSSSGTALNTVLTMSGNNVTANGNLAGNADLRSGVYYHLGDLTINAGVTITVNNNVQLRVRGAVTINGVIDGVGRGKAAITEINVVDDPEVHPNQDTPLTVSTFGSTRSSAGVRRFLPTVYQSGVGRAVSGAAAIARPALTVVSGALNGMPSELRGTPGKAGGPLTDSTVTANNVEALGGDGGISGAGLAIVCRDVLSFGASGEIDLSGGDGTAPSSTTLGSHTVYPGAGAGGAPGTLLVLLDGNDIPLPDLTDAFVALIGETPQTGTPIPQIGELPSDPLTGFDPGLSQIDLWQSAFLSMWVPQEIDTGDGDDEIVPAPTALAGVGSFLGAEIVWANPALNKFDFVELWRATTNDRTGAVRIFRGQADAFSDRNTSWVTRYYWVRAGRENGGFSAWYPTGSTSGVAVTFGERGTGVGWVADIDGKPAGIRGLTSIADRSQLFLTDGALRITSNPDNVVVYGFPAIPINDAKQYQLTVRFRSSASSVDGAFFGAYEKNAAPAAGKTHIGAAGGESSVVDLASTSNVGIIADAPMPGTTAVEMTAVYTPTSGTEYASFSIGNIGATTSNVELLVEWMALTELGSNVDLLPGVRPPGDTADLVPNAATVVYQADDDGPLDATLASGSSTADAWLGTPTAVQVYATTDVILVTMSFSVEITALGTAPSTHTGCFGGTSLVSPSFAANTVDKTTAAVENASSVMTVTGLSPGTYYFGPGTKITHTNGGGATTVRIRNVEIQIAVVRK